MEFLVLSPHEAAQLRRATQRGIHGGSTRARPGQWPMRLLVSTAIRQGADLCARSAALARQLKWQMKFLQHTKSEAQHTEQMRRRAERAAHLSPAVRIASRHVPMEENQPSRSDGASRFDVSIKTRNVRSFNS
jgi:hypothetical protein